MEEFYSTKSPMYFDRVATEFVPHIWDAGESQIRSRLLEVQSSMYRSPLTWAFPGIADEVFELVGRHPQLGEFVQASASAIQLLADKKVPFLVHVSQAVDVESPEWQGLSIEFHVELSNFDDLLALWDELAKAVFDHLSPDSAKMVEVIVSPLRRKQAET